MVIKFSTIPEENEICLTVRGMSVVDEIVILKIVYHNVTQRGLTNRYGDYNAGKTYPVNVYVIDEAGNKSETLIIKSELPWIIDTQFPGGKTFGFDQMSRKLTKVVKKFFGEPSKRWKPNLKKFLDAIAENQRTERTSLMMREMINMIGVEGIVRELRKLEVKEVLEG